MANKLGDWIRRERAIRKWTLRHLGELSKVPFSLIGQIERGEIERPRTETIERLARAFGVRIEFLNTLAEGRDPDEEATLARLRDLMGGLSPEDQEEVIRFAQWRAAQMKGNQ